MSIEKLAKSSCSTWMPAPPAPEVVIAALCRQVGVDLPTDYLNFLRFSNGGSGELPVQPWWFDSLWTAEQLADFNDNYEVSEYCPDFFGIGSSGGGEMFAFDMRGEQPWPVVILPFIGMEELAAVLVAPDFRTFVTMFGKPKP